MDRLELRTLVRGITRTEEQDVADANLDVYLDEGYSEVVSNREWPWGYSLTPVTVPMIVGTNVYTLDDTVKRVLAVIELEQRYPLKSVSQSDWARTQESIDSSSRPVWYTFTNKNLHIWPVPATTDSLDVYYYEHPVWGGTDTDEPVFESSFHTIIADWAMSRLWEQEEDFEKADDYRQRFEVKLARMAKFYNTEMIDRPMIYGGGQSTSSAPSSMPWLGDARLGGAV